MLPSPHSQMNIQEAFAEKTPVNHQHNAGGRKYNAEKRTGDGQLVPCSARAPQPSLTWGKAPRGRPMGWRPTTPAEAKPSQQVPVCWSPTILAHTAAVPHRPSLHPEAQVSLDRLLWSRGCWKKESHGALQQLTVCHA